MKLLKTYAKYQITIIRNTFQENLAYPRQTPGQIWQKLTKTCLHHGDDFLREHLYMTLTCYGQRVDTDACRKDRWNQYRLKSLANWIFARGATRLCRPILSCVSLEILWQKGKVDKYQTSGWKGQKLKSIFLSLRYNPPFEHLTLADKLTLCCLLKRIIIFRFRIFSFHSLYLVCVSCQVKHTNLALRMCITIICNDVFVSFLNIIVICEYVNRLKENKFISFIITLGHRNSKVHGKSKKYVFPITKQ